MKLSDFKINHYPDGHKHIVSNLDLHGDNTLSVSIRSFDDLFLVAQAKAIHPELTILRITYLLGARCDRRFSPGEAVDLRIVCEYINFLGFDHIIVVKPHSMAILYDVFGKKWSSEDHTNRLIKMIPDDKRHHVYIAPDKNAVAQNNACGIMAKPCSKTRDKNGVVSELQVPDLSTYKDATFVMVDDLCDGGKTFTEIAKKIRLTTTNPKVYLIVTHAIFSKGFEPFEGLIDHIFCTNSFADFEHPLVTQIKI